MLRIQLHAYCRASLTAVAILLLPHDASHAHGSAHERISTLTKSLIADPLNAAQRFELATMLTEHGDWTPALAHLDRVDELAPGRFPTAFVRAEALAAGGQFQRASEVLDTLLRSHPENADALMLRARVRSEMAQPAAAAADFGAAMRLLPAPSLEQTLEYADRLEAVSEHATALRVLDGARIRFGASRALVMRAVGQECALGNLSDALARIDAAIAAAPVGEKPSWLAEKARFCMGRGIPGDAKTVWESLLADLSSRPALERHTPALEALAAEARAALGLASTITARRPPPPPAPAP